MESLPITQRTALKGTRSTDLNQLHKNPLLSHFLDPLIPEGSNAVLL